MILASLFIKPLKFDQSDILSLLHVCSLRKLWAELGGEMQQIARTAFDSKGQLLKSSRLTVQEVMYTPNFLVQIMLQYVENTELIFDNFMTP
jgi:hypothetical protein